MYIKQLSVFLENTKGSLAKLTGLLAEKKFDLIAMSIAETAEYGILRCIVKDTDACTEALREEGYVVRQTEVLGIAVEDKPGGLASILQYLAKEDVSVEYLYSFVRGNNDRALLIMYVSDTQKAEALLRAKGVELLLDEQLNVL